MGVNLWINRQRIYLDIYTGGRRWRESTGLRVCPDENQNMEIMKLAEILRSKKELQVVSGANGLIDPMACGQSLYIYVKRHGSTKDKKHHWNKALPYIAKYDPNIQIGSITPPWFKRYQDWLLEQSGLSLQTCEHYACTVRTLMKKAVRDGIIVNDPCESIKHISVPEKTRFYLSLDEIERLVHTPLGGALGGEIKKAFLFAIYTGLRICDLKSLIWSDINIDLMQIVLRKGKSKHIVPLIVEAWNCIHNDTLHLCDALVFPLLTASRTNTNQYLNTWAKKANVDKPLGWYITLNTFKSMKCREAVDALPIFGLSK